MDPADKSRIFAGTASAAFHILILLVLIAALRGEPPTSRSEALIDVTFDNPPAPQRQRIRPRPTVPHDHRQPASHSGAPAAAALAYPPPIPLAQATLPASPYAGSGLRANPGSGAAGSGSDAGDGAGQGVGQGNGDGGSDAEWIGGEIRNSDFPDRAAARGAQGTVRTEITVAPNGRASGCQITGSSGDPDLDATTCRLILRRFRFRAATDDAGHPTTDTVEYDQEWVLSRATDVPAAH